MKIPEDFKHQYIEIRGENDFHDFVTSFKQQPPVSIRINPMKWHSGYAGDIVPWASNAGYLMQRPLFACDPLWHAGAYYVQDSSSMFLEHVFSHLELMTDSPVVLDLCGAPGGKSTHLASILDGKGFLVTNEVIRSRCTILLENMRKWGASNVAVTNNDPARIGKLKGLFDVIVADAPCSGEGLFRKNPEAMTEWSLQNVALCADRQKRIIADVWPSLKPGGYLIYSTCTFNKEENENNLKWIKENHEAEILSIPIQEGWNLVPSEMEGVFGWHFYPHRVDGEGFFISVIRKTDGLQFKKTKKRDLRSFKSISAKVLSPNEFFAKDMVFLEKQKQVFAVDPEWTSLTDLLNKELKTVSTGIHAGQISAKGFVPSHDLYINPYLRKDFIKVVDLESDDALRFIGREPFIPEGLEKGSRYLASYRGVPLGGLKYLGNRINTTYPVEWRLRKKCDTVSDIL